MSIDAIRACGRCASAACLLLALCSCAVIGHGTLVPAPLLLFSSVTYYPPCAPSPERVCPERRSPAVPRPPTRFDMDAHLVSPRPGPGTARMPTCDAEMPQFYERLVQEDDDTVRDALIDLVAARVDDMMCSWRWKWTHRRVDLPPEFGARMLRLAMPLLEADRGRFSNDEELRLLPMLLQLLEAMRYGPALEVLMRPQGFARYVSQGEHSAIPAIWAGFGRAAVQRLVERVHAADPTHAANGVGRPQALRALARIRDAEAVQALEGLLDDADPDIRTAAAEALREIRPSK